MAFAKFQENRFRIDGEITENHAILVNLTASIEGSRPPLHSGRFGLLFFVGYQRQTRSGGIPRGFFWFFFLFFQDLEFVKHYNKTLKGEH